MGTAIKHPVLDRVKHDWHSWCISGSWVGSND